MSKRAVLAFERMLEQETKECRKEIERFDREYDAMPSVRKYGFAGDSNRAARLQAKQGTIHLLHGALTLLSDHLRSVSGEELEKCRKELHDTIETITKL